jgi:crotonobetainyl-CoA:carnitine CoA-transferase CaiB-like acyl-CoA transferase
MSGAFDGVRVIDLAQGIGGPYAAMLLADQGADVVKIEPPDGDPYRVEPGFRVLNRGKRGVTADLDDHEGHRRALEMIAAADVLIYDGSPEEQRRLGLDYDALARENTGLVYCWMPPYGSRGPYAERTADDALVAALDGVMGTQFALRVGPTFITVPLSSYGAAILAAGATAAALRVRHRTGLGQLVEVSWLAGGFAVQTGTVLLGEGISRFAGSGQNPMGPNPVYRIYRAADDGYLFLACGHAGFFHGFCLIIDRPELISDPRFEGAPWGIVDPSHRDALAAMLEPIFAGRRRDEWLRLLAEADIPAAPVMTRDDYLADPQVRHNGLRVEVADPEAGMTLQPSPAVLLHGTPGSIQGPAPRLGQHDGSGWSVGARSPMNVSGELPPHALTGLRVLDLSAYIAGSLCPMMLADWGADVVKVEGLDGDPFRSFGFGFLGWNRGKRSLAVDLKQADGRALVYDLVRGADVVVENFRPGVSERLGVDYETLRAINPRLVYSTETAYGRSGPYVAMPGFDPLMQARSGMMASQGGMEGGHTPVFLTVALCDYGAALSSTYGILAALFAREQTGEGQRVETTLMNAAMAMQMTEFLRYEERPAPLQGGPEFLGPAALYRAYEAQDGWLFLAADAPELWAPLTQALDRIDLLHACSAAEAAEAPADGELAESLAATFLTRPVADWLDRCDRAGVPVGPVLDGPALFRDPHIAANELVVGGEHPTWGRVRQTGQLVKFGRTPGRIGPVAPLLGQHTEEVLREAGMAPERVAELRARGVISQLERAPDA